MPPPGTNDASATLGSFRAVTALLEKALQDIKKAWDMVLDKVRAVLRKIQHEINSDSIWSTIVEWVWDDMKDAIDLINRLVDELKTKVDKIIDKVTDAVGGSAPVLSLLDTAVKYNDMVIAPFTDIGTKMSSTGNIVYWTGPTKEAYDRRVTEQGDASEATADMLVATSAWLAEVGTGNLTYITDLGKKAAEVVGALTTAAIDAGESVAGIITQVPLALKDLSDVIGVAVNQTIQYVLDLGNYLGSSVQKVNGLANSQSNHTGLGSDGNWPTIKA